ncbi:MAG: Asp-tRNA(Asn)/Glu-tRNA(Gln) amidotransferase GatCAB subunit B, partial [Gammaproteobacteria bacterium]|nr:Asp-tRNA(Asn)/Glu-tRNA(Gln) amidotransferase GatCAB subunit B [Gammaproteobacteria bacterium]
PKLAANWVMGDWSAALNRDGLEPAANPMDPVQLGTLITRIKDGTISGKIAKSLFDDLWRDSAARVDDLIQAQGLVQVSDTDALGAMIRQVVEDNPAQLAQYRAGKTKVFGFFVGQLMKATQGKANPQTLNELLKAALDG